ncbi:MAG: hypothetical protein AAGG53_00715 [Cyanobacteria bacterium P01_H01_bin.152]
MPNQRNYSTDSVFIALGHGQLSTAQPFLCGTYAVAADVGPDIPHPGEIGCHIPQTWGIDQGGFCASPTLFNGYSLISRY